MKLGERFRLEVHWEKAIYEKEGICKLKNAHFYGPALSEAQKINDNDHIMLDFFKQYKIIVKNIYVAKLSWKQVVYEKDGKVSLKNAMVTHNTELNRVPKLKSTDYLVIDTSEHEVEKHPFNMLYKTYVVNENAQLYGFGG